MQGRRIVGWCFVAIAGALAAATAFRPSVAPAEIISGPAQVIDGDSLQIGAITIRLHAVDAFEGRQTCGEGASAWACGGTAANKLRTLTGRRAVDCEKVDTDNYGRTVAICRTGDVDLGAEMVRSGLALAYREFGDRYVDEEDEARIARRGAWKGTFTAPWDERRRGSNDRPSQRRDAEPELAEPSPGNCTAPRIKGNISRNGERIYHVPGSRNYDVTRINAAGEGWFCTEQDARAAGWRAPRYAPR